MRGEFYLRSMLSWYRMDFDGQVDYFQMLGGDYDAQPYDNVIRKYNKARAVVLGNGYDALMTIESDTIVPRDALKRLAAVEADVVYGLYVWRNGFPFWNAYMELGADHGLPISIDLQAVRAAWGKVIETKGVGNGCTLIRRRVLEALEFKWSPGEFGCCDWHLAVDCQRLGFVQKHDMGVVCGHIAVNPVHRILWPDPEAKGLYRQEVLEKWPDLPRPMEDKQQTGVDHSRDPAPGSQMKVIVKKHFHLGGGVYRSPGEEIDLPVELARNLLRRRLVKRPGDEEPGWTLKESCGGCSKARAEA
jgi:hypothetical protein